MIEKEIVLINKIIREAVIHGADCGGSYNQNTENLISAIEDWLQEKNQLTLYTVRDIPVGDGWETYQIVKR